MTLSFCLAAFTLSALANAEDPDATKGIVPLPDYSGTTLERAFLTGDWGGIRERWAANGLTFDVQWTQFTQGVTSGGFDTGWDSPGSIDAVVRFDMMRANLWPALVTMRVESRYGDSVNSDTGLLLPSNTDIAFPLTSPADEDVLAAITELNVIQPLSEKFGLVIGKIQTLDNDPSEFASGRGRDQFQQFPLVVSSVVALTVPYSTLGVGMYFQASPTFDITTTFMNSTDSSTTSGFDDIDDGTTWATVAHFQHQTGELPGGSNVGFIYAFNGDFRRLSGILQPPFGDGGGERESDSWAAFWTGWQYLSTRGPATAPIRAGDAMPDLVGYGIFTRLGSADADTNPIAWSWSIGFGGRGVASRDDDTFGVAYFFNDLEDPNTVDLGALSSASSGVEAYYGYAVTKAARLSFDAQWLESAFDNVDDAIVLGFRLNVVL